MDRDILDVEEHDEDEESQLRPHSFEQYNDGTFLFMETSSEYP